MKEIRVESIPLRLLSEGNNVRVKSSTEDIVIFDQTIDKVSNLIMENFNIVNNHYLEMV